jgi:hypothetical protein
MKWRNNPKYHPFHDIDKEPLASFFYQKTTYKWKERWLQKGEFIDFKLMTNNARKVENDKLRTQHEGTRELLYKFEDPIDFLRRSKKTSPFNSMTC